MAEVIKNIGLRLGYRKIQTSGYNPSCNGACERFGRFLGAALTIFADRYRSLWDEYLDAALFAYRISVNEVTGFSPYYLMYGREPTFPVDFYYGPETQSFEDERQHGLRVSRALREAYHVVREQQQKSAEKNKTRRDKTQHRPPRLAVGSSILLWEPEQPFLDESSVLVKTRKLLYRYSGPHQIVHDDLESPGLMYWIRRDDGVRRHKKQRVNANRLWRFKRITPDTTQRTATNPEISDREWLPKPPLPKTQPESQFLRPDANTELQPGQFVIVPLEVSFDDDGNTQPFGVGRVLEHLEDGTIDLHWYDNRLGHPVGTFRPGWLDGKSRWYYRKTPTHWSHRQHTNVLTKSTLTLSQIACYGFALTTGDRLPPAVIQFLHETDTVNWSIPDVAIPEE
jgi:hypothetical protein